MPTIFPQKSRRGQTLVICPIGLGNFLMATPALKALSRALGPEALCLLALRPGITALAQDSGLFGKILTWNPDQEGLGRGFSLLREIRNIEFENSLALFPTSHWKFSLFHFFAGAKHRWGFAYPHQHAPAWVQRHSLPLESLHDTPQNLRLVEAFLGEKIPDTGAPYYPSVPNPPKEGIPSRPYFVCHPGSSAERGMAEKRLPLPSFAALIQKLHRAFGLGCVLVGGPEEQALRQELLQQCGEAMIPASPRSLGETAALLQGARFFFGNDSGLMHLSASVGTRCAAFFGPTDEHRTGPFGYEENIDGIPRHLILRQAGLACAPCWTLRTVGKNPPCIYGDTRCLRDFSRAAMWEKLKEWVGHLDSAR